MDDNEPTEKSNVVILGGLTKLSLPIERIVSNIPIRDLEWVFVIGVRNDGTIYRATSTSDSGRLNLTLDQFKLMLIAGEFSP